MNDNARCPSCDTANSPQATFCQHCGRPMGAHAAAAPAGTCTTTATGGSSKTGAYMIGAVTVAVVLMVGGTTTAAPPPPSPPAITAAPVPTVAPGVGTVTFDQAVAFFRSYITTALNGDHATAWNMLSERDQRDCERGFDQFVGFWQSVWFADVRRVDPLGGGPSFQSLRADMAYGQADGDLTSFEVIDVDVNVRPDGLLQIFDYRFVGKQ